jgi:hypothetical protein
MIFSVQQRNFAGKIYRLSFKQMIKLNLSKFLPMPVLTSRKRVFRQEKFRRAALQTPIIGEADFFRAARLPFCPRPDSFRKKILQFRIK